MSEQLYVALLCVHAHSIVLLPRAARCLPRFSCRWPCERCWRLAAAADLLLASGRSVALGLQAVRCLVRNGVLAVQGPGLFSGCSCSRIRGELLHACFHGVQAGALASAAVAIMARTMPGFPVGFAVRMSDPHDGHVTP